MKQKILTFALLLTPSIAHAHVIGGVGLASGALHPLTGLDHLLAMVAVGVLASRYTGKARWTVPATFLAAMLAGGVLGMLIGVPTSFIEAGIALSVLVLGLAVFLPKKIPLQALSALVAFSALLHGHAHGTELPLLASPMLYTFGFLAVTASLHVSGVFLGGQLRKHPLSQTLLRYAGAGMSALGLVLLLA